METFLWIVNLWNWFTSPSIIPWVGASVAFGASALASFLPLRGRFLRALCVAVVWLVVAGVVGLLVSSGRGTGNGNGPGNGEGKPIPEPDLPVTVRPGEYPPGTPEHVDLLIHFVPSEGNTRYAETFSCNLITRDGKQISIRAKDMRHFDELLDQQLRSAHLPKAPEPLAIRIIRSPFPGESVITRVKKQVKEVLGNVSVEFADPSVP